MCDGYFTVAVGKAQISVAAIWMLIQFVSY
jgi:hypothetical protein